MSESQGPKPGNGQPYNVVVEINPALAAAWLEKNECNRRLNWDYVAQLSRDMKAGRFTCTHQGIAFDCNGRLIDGQHRLWAIVDADIPVKMRVFYNEAPENLINIDGNRPRRAADRITINGSLGTVRVDELATLRTMLGGVGATAKRRTVHEEADLLRKHRDAIRFALEYLPKSSQTAGVATAIAWAIIARAWYYVPDNVLIRFCDVLRTGLATCDAEQAIVLLWKHLAGHRNQGGTRAMRQRRYGVIQRALVAYVDCESLSVIRPATNELFPLPEETNQLAAN